MDIRSADTGTIGGSVNQVNAQKKQLTKSKVGFSLQKKSADLQIQVNKNIVENRTSSSKGSKVNLFA